MISQQLKCALLPSSCRASLGVAFSGCKPVQLKCRAAGHSLSKARSSQWAAPKAAADPGV